MLQLTVKQAKTGFLDRPAVTAALGRTRARVYARWGSYLRAVARNSMKSRPWTEAAPPGTPPFAHPQTGAMLRGLLFYATDPTTKTLVVGPARLSTSNAPAIQEFGGTHRRRNWRRRDYRVGLHGPIRLVTAPGQQLAEAVMASGGMAIDPPRPEAIWVELKTASQVNTANLLAERLFGPKYRLVRNRPHPYMAPALDKTRAKMAPAVAGTFT